MEIPDPPDRPVCAQHGPLRWGYYPDTKQGPRWVSSTLETVDGLGAVLVPHICDDPGKPPLRWQPSETVAATAHRGAALVRQVLAGQSPFTEEQEQ